MSARPADLVTKLLLCDLTKLVRLRASAMEAAPLIDRYAAWLERQKEATARRGTLGRPKFVLTPERQKALDHWGATIPRPALIELAKALGCSIGKAHALAKALPPATVAPTPETPLAIHLQLHECSQCGANPELSEWEFKNPDGTVDSRNYDVQCVDCPNRTQPRATEMEAITAWNAANPVAPP